MLNLIDYVLHLGTFKDLKQIIIRKSSTVNYLGASQINNASRLKCLYVRTLPDQLRFHRFQ